MTDHEPNSALREQLRLENENAKARAFERWHEFLTKRQREKAEKARKSS